MSRRTALLAATLVVVAAGLVLLVMRFGIGGAGTSEAGAPGSVAEVTAPADDPIPSTSEALIAEALAAGDIGYEDSLRARAYALFDDPRLEPAFRSPIVNWEAMSALLDEIEEKEATLSQELLDDLLPFRVRPNDPRSIIDRPREDILRTQSGAAPLQWLGVPVPGTGLMVWIQGTRQDLRKYVDMAAQVWEAFPAFFPYPLDDAPGLAVGPFNSRAVNPDNKIDIHLIDGLTQDPRLGNCQNCALGTNAGWAREAPNTLRARTGSGYVLLNKSRSDDEVIDTIAHELHRTSNHSHAHRSTPTGIGTGAGAPSSSWRDGLERHRGRTGRPPQGDCPQEDGRCRARARSWSPGGDPAGHGVAHFLQERGRLSGECGRSRLGRTGNPDLVRPAQDPEPSQARLIVRGWVGGLV